MTIDSVTTMKIISVVLIILGIGLSIWGYRLSSSFGSRIKRVVRGSITNKVMIFYITGTISFVIGLYLFIKN